MWYACCIKSEYGKHVLIRGLGSYKSEIRAKWAGKLNGMINIGIIHDNKGRFAS
jgi:hypothetical protein